MQKYKKLSPLLLAIVVAAVLSGSVSAMSGSGGSDSTESANSTDSTTTPTTENRQLGGMNSERRGELEKRGQQKIEEVKAKREDHKEKTAEQRKKACESHKQGLTKKFERITTNSQRIQDRITKILDKGVAYQKSDNLTVTDWDALLTAANTAKDTSQNSINDLKEVTPTIDCNNTSVASDVATFKAAAATTRDNLKAYKTAVKALLKALKEAQPATTETTTEGNQQ